MFRIGWPGLGSELAPSVIRRGAPIRSDPGLTGHAMDAVDPPLMTQCGRQRACDHPASYRKLPIRLPRRRSRAVRAEFRGQALWPIYAAREAGVSIVNV